MYSAAQGFQSGHHGLSHFGSGAANAGVDFNLASTQANFLAGNLANFSNLTIDVGGRQELVALNTRLTAAELVAVQQVMTTGSQSIKLNANGAASGGSLTLGDNLLTALNNSVGSISSLTIARGVQVVDTLSNFSASDRIANYGTILTASSTAGSTDTISSAHIHNAYGGSIASYGGDGTLFAADPALVAAYSLTNSGSISSSGNLTLNAPVISNSLGHGSGNQLPSITAAQNVNITTNELTNNGLIAALSGNVNVSAPGGLNMNGLGGTIQADSGNINFDSQHADINIGGGDLLSRGVNIAANGGNINANLGNVSGVLTTCGETAHVIGSGTLLTLGSTAIDGDPTFANTTGGIDIVGPIATGGDAIAILAAGNISIPANANVTIKTDGGNITLVAGAAITTSAGKTTSLPGGVPLLAFETAKVSGVSATGGNIDLKTNNTSAGNVIDASNANANGNGGTVTLIAYAGNAGTGTITVPSILSSGQGTGTNGSVTVMAGSSSAVSAIDLPLIRTTTTATGGGGNISIFNAQPTGTVTFNSLGFGSGTFKAGALSTGTIILGQSDTGGTGKGGNFFATGAGSALLGNSLTTGGDYVATGFKGSVQLNLVNTSAPNGGGARAGNITVSGDNILATSLLFTIGGNGVDQGPGASGKTGLNGGAGGNAGNITFTADNGITLANTSVINATGGNGGKGGNGGSSANASGTGGSGGAGGAGGNGGQLTFKTVAGDIALLGTIASDGGFGGGGGVAQAGVTNAKGVGGAGGSGGSGGVGGNSGLINVVSASGNIDLATITATGGSGGSAASGA
ncbi:MAG: hypothetical protein JSS86_19650, partial [Cyanobacteria bacterium SZAS LIN-2]|nr:hypothetical protein [Cyanobacteria bacterium SZAS LIN-2]